ncbi:MAG: tRNA (adenosine(37)-N6)-threonylcarbamoyltransferase complex ATPase subunit type 1 TsaE, partial [Candidatus Dormiibacterota bacterium]
MSHSPTETLILGEALGRSARPGDVILLAGPLGAGKTVLVQGIAAGLGSVATVGSPTFVLVRQYNGRLPLVHADLYRLEGRKEIDGLGLLELSE